MKIACILLPDFEVAIELRRRPELAGRPVIVGGLPHERKCVRSRSPEAAAAGAAEGMPLRQAGSLCPEALFLPVEEQLYRDTFTLVLRVLDGFSPSVEGAYPAPSPVRRAGVTLGLARVTCAPPAPANTRRQPGEVERTSRDNTQLRHDALRQQGKSGKNSGTSLSWWLHDRPVAIYLDASGLERLFGADRELGRRMASEVERETGLRPQVGLAGGKFVARMAALLAAPGEVLVVREGEEATFLAPLPVEQLPCSAEMRRRLHLFGLRTLGQLASLPAGALAEQFGPEGMEASRLARGVDERAVVARELPLLLAEEAELEPPTNNRTPLTRLVSEMVERLSVRLRSCYLACREITLDLTFSDGLSAHTSTTLHEPTADAKTLGRAVERLLQRCEHPDDPTLGAPSPSSASPGRQLPAEVVEAAWPGLAGHGCPPYGPECSLDAVEAACWPGGGRQAPPLRRNGPDSPPRVGEGPGERSISRLRVSLSGFGGYEGEQLGLFRSRSDGLKRIRRALRQAEEQFGEEAIRPMSEMEGERAPARPLSITPDAGGSPMALLLGGRWERVLEVCNRWRVQEEWWRQEVRRDYYRVIAESGRLCLIYRDLSPRPPSAKREPRAHWFLERIYG